MKDKSVCKYCQESFEKPLVHFLCPNDGILHQEKVNFACNRCEQNEMIFKDGIYFCPQCFTESDSYECQICGSTEVSALKNINDQRGRVA